MKLLKIFFKLKARRKLTLRYLYLNEVNKILEAYETHRILVGGSKEYIAKCRGELVKKQNSITENSKFIEFLKKI